MKRKIIAGVLLALCVFALCAVGVTGCETANSNPPSQEQPSENQKPEDQQPEAPAYVASEGLVYELSSDGKYYTCTGRGNCVDSHLKIAVDKGGIPVTRIGEGAFKGITSFTEVTLPEGIEGIGKQAFSGCTALTRINVAATVTTIGANAFENCSCNISWAQNSKLTVLTHDVFNKYQKTSVTLPSGLTEIKPMAFSDSLFESVTIPENVEKIDGRAFYHSCVSQIEVASGNNYYKSVDGVLYTKNGETLVAFPPKKQPNSNTVNVPVSVKNIGNDAFYGCEHINIVNLHDGVRTIGEQAFMDSNVEFINIPDGVETIEKRAFMFCEILKQVTLGSNVRCIEEYAFAFCDKLMEITIPAAVDFICANAFLSAALKRAVFVNAEGWYAVYERGAEPNEFEYIKTTNLTSVSFAADLLVGRTNGLAGKYWYRTN